MSSSSDGDRTPSVNCANLQQSGPVIDAQSDEAAAPDHASVSLPGRRASHRSPGVPNRHVADRTRCGRKEIGPGNEIDVAVREHGTNEIVSRHRARANLLIVEPMARVISPPAQHVFVVELVAAEVADPEKGSAEPSQRAPNGSQAADNEQAQFHTVVAGCPAGA
jgi:hypothetical protein